jgi:UDP-glucose 4-epimerase
VRKSLVVGAGGFLGTNLSLRLLAMGQEVRAFGRRSRVWNAPYAIEWIDADLADVDALRRAVRGVDTVYHLISTTVPSAARASPLQDVMGNLVATIRLLDECVEAGISRVVFTSSGGTVYGQVKSTPIFESAETNPISSYGVGKLAIEKYLNLYRHLGMIAPISLRIANPYGPFQLASHNQGAIAVFSRRALRHEPIEIWGDGSVVRDYLFIDDVIDALISAADFVGEESVFNIGSGIGRSLLDIVQSIEEQLGRHVEVVHKPGRAVDVPVNVLDVSRAARALQWAPKTSFQNGLSRTISWIRNQEGICRP